MDAKELLRRYIEQRRELGESELVLHSLNIDDVMRVIGAAGASRPFRCARGMEAPSPIGRELRPSDTRDWRTSLRDAGVNVETPPAAAAPPIEAPPETELPAVTPTDDTAFTQ